MTVLHYTGSNWDGTGVHAVIRELAQGGKSRAILGVGPEFVAEKTPHVRAWRGPAVADDAIGLANALRTLCVAWRVRRWLARGSQRVFHGHSRAGLLVALWLRLFGGRRVVASVHVYGRQRWFYRLAARVLGQRLVWLTPAMKRHYGVAPADWSGCVPNGLVRPWATTMRRPAPRSGLRLGGAGLLVPWKRWDLVIEALARLPAEARVEFFHIGGPLPTPESRAQAEHLRRLAETRGVAGRVHWLGWRASSAELLREVDAVVVASDGEPFSMIALEAWFAGVPVVATRGGGPEDFIAEGRNGWLVPSGDADALAACFQRLVEPAAWTDVQQDEAQLRKFSVPNTLAATWATLYARL